MEPKKISFSFKKTKKTEKPAEEEKKEFIECVEEQAIKVVGGEEIKEETVLVIPMKPNTLLTAERLKQIAEEVEKAVEEPELEEKLSTVQDEVKPAENETLDQMAVRELLQDAKKEIKVDLPALTVALPSKSIADGEKESTLDDYEAVPIQQFGLAMLRGMGWAPGKEQKKFKEPPLRPKGLGLGADKALKDSQKKNASNTPQDKEDLAVVKNACVKIIGGKYNGCYGKIVSLDEDMGRVMVDIPVRKETVSVNECMLVPVSKSEFDKQSKVINADSYEEYKKKENTRHTKIESKSSNGASSSHDNDKNRSDSRRDEYRKENNDYKQERREYVRKESTMKDSRESDRKRSDSTEREHKRSLDRRSRRNSSSSEDRAKIKSTIRDSSSEDDRSRIRDRKKNERRRKFSSIEERTNDKTERRRYSSNDSLSTDSDKKDKRRKKRDSSSDSEQKYKSSKKSKKRDIDKKRKGKKKKRDRDRSPNYKKHRK